MEKEKILEKAQSKKTLIGEMERQKGNKGNWIALIITGVIATALIITECALGNFAGALAVAIVCYGWASAQYFFQYFLAKRPWPVLFGAVLHGLAFVASIVFFVLFCLKVI